MWEINVVRERPEDGIFIMNPNRTEVQGVDMDDIIAQGGGGFGIGGHVVEETKSQKCLCKIELQTLGTGTRPLYFVRMDGAGSLYDPFGIDEGAAAKLNKHQGAEHWSHRRVDRTVFEQYLAFLSTRNKAHLLNAQRNNR